MKTFKIVGGIFSLIGVLALLGGIVYVVSTSSFIAKSVITEGKIIDYEVVSSHDSDGYSSSTYPIIQFKDKNGRPFVFRSSVSSNNIVIGETAVVRYVPENPTNAKKTDSFIDMWLPAILFAVFGVSFSGLGIPVFYLGIRDDLNKRRSKYYTKTISADIIDVIRNYSISSNGRSPYQLVAQWLDPDTNKVYIFKSKYFWYDPSKYLINDNIIIKTDPQDIEKYYMDVSFLPESGE